MSEYWKQQFRHRMTEFASRRDPNKNEVPVSIKVRVTSGCFHREHSPQAYRIIDKYLDSIPPEQIDCVLEEHESGPEVLVYLAVTTAGIALAKSIVDLITTIIKARSEGIQKGDHRRDALKLIIRRTRRNGEFIEEEVMQFESHDPVLEIEIEESLNAAASRVLQDELPNDS